MDIVQKTNQLDLDQPQWAVTFKCNTTVHTSTNCTPAKLFSWLGTDLTLPLDLACGTKPSGLRSLEGCPMGFVEKLKVGISKLYQFLIAAEC